MSALEQVLIDVGMKISRPENWTQGAMARRKSDAPVQPASSYAVKWDIIGAVYAVFEVNPKEMKGVSNEDWKALNSALCALSLTAHRIHKKTTEGVNDGGTHEEALELVRAAIRHERKIVSLQS